MKLSISIQKHGTARRPTWVKDAYIYLSPEKKLYFSTTKAPYQATMDDINAADFEPYVAPAPAPLKTWAERNSVDNRRTFSRVDLANACGRATRKHLVVGVNEIADELGLP